MCKRIIYNELIPRIDPMDSLYDLMLEIDKAGKYSTRYPLLAGEGRLVMVDVWERSPVSLSHSIKLRRISCKPLGYFLHEKISDMYIVFENRVVLTSVLKYPTRTDSRKESSQMHA